MTQPPLTIGLPVYNGSRFLPQALTSIQQQTYTDFELLVSDNGSTDDSRDIVREHARDDERIRLLESPVNRGAAWNYNRVFAESRSALFKWAAADDELEPTCVARSLEVLEASDPSVVVVFPVTRMVDEEGNTLREIVDPLDMPVGASAHERLRRVVAGAVYGNVVFGLMRSDALRRTRGHGAYPSSDLVLLAELALLGSFRLVAEPLFLRREHLEMSRKANPTLEEMSRFFDPQGPVTRHEHARVFVEHLRAIRRADLSAWEKGRCYQVFLTTWVRRHDELRIRLARLGGRLRRTRAAET